MPTKKSKKQINDELTERFATAIAQIERSRASDTRSPGYAGTQGAYLTQDLLKRRQQLTKNGAQDLILQYGFNGPKGRGREKRFSLDELNQMAAKLKTATKEFHGRQKGVLVEYLIKKTLQEDKEAARKVTAATLYRIDGTTLFFRVTASGETPQAPSHYLVKVRLEEWDYQVNKHKGDNYQKSAIKATHGRVSFDCACGRHQYWYRYLAGIGGFAIEPPKETVFPKIRNPKLRGCCCKHVMKVLLALQTAPVQGSIAKHMEARAKEQSFASDDAVFLSEQDVAAAEKAGTFNTLGALRKFNSAMKAFAKKQKQPQVKAAKEKLKRDSEAKMKEKDAKIKRQNEAIRTTIMAMLQNMAVTAKRYGTTFESQVDYAIQENPQFKFTKKQAMDIAVEGKVIAPDGGLL